MSHSEICISWKGLCSASGCQICPYVTFQPSTCNAGLPGVLSHDSFLKDGQGSSFPQNSVRIFKCFDLKNMYIV